MSRKRPPHHAQRRNSSRAALRRAATLVIRVPEDAGGITKSPEPSGTTPWRKRRTNSAACACRKIEVSRPLVDPAALARIAFLGLPFSKALSRCSRKIWPQSKVTHNTDIVSVTRKGERAKIASNCAQGHRLQPCTGAISILLRMRANLVFRPKKSPVVSCCPRRGGAPAKLAGESIILEDLYRCDDKSSLSRHPPRIPPSTSPAEVSNCNFTRIL